MSQLPVTGPLTSPSSAPPFDDVSWRRFVSRWLGHTQYRTNSTQVAVFCLGLEFGALFGLQMAARQARRSRGFRAFLRRRLTD